MQDLRINLRQLWIKLPAIILLVMVNSFIFSAVAGVVMLELQVMYPNSTWPLVVAILVAVAVYLWIAYNHKLRNYIKQEGNTNE